MDSSCGSKEELRTSGMNVTEPSGEPESPITGDLKSFFPSGGPVTASVRRQELVMCSPSQLTSLDVETGITRPAVRLGLVGAIVFLLVSIPSKSGHSYRHGPG